MASGVTLMRPEVYMRSESYMGVLLATLSYYWACESPSTVVRVISSSYNYELHTKVIL